MNLSYFPKFTALQSEPIWKAFLEGCIANNITVVENSMTADAVVIWSVLWHGRMQNNFQIYQHYRSQNKPVFIIEVGALCRGVTWKISINNITSAGIYPTTQIDVNRPKKLGLSLASSIKKYDSILIATQHPKSLQWANMPAIEQWVTSVVREVKQHSDRKIIIRPHPRWPIRTAIETIEQPIKLPNTYDVFNIDYNHHCVINYNSGPSIQAAIAGTLVICDKSSLAHPISTSIQQIENPILIDREEWFLNICHTEWTVEEIKQGIPQRILLDFLH
jgi:hypothetical protein